MERKSCFRLGMMIVASTVLALGSAHRAQATTITGALTADNAFFAYLSTSNTSLGTLIAQGNDWPSTFNFTDIALTPGQTYYLQIEAINYGGPGAIIGQFTLSDSGFQFANGTSTLLTDTTDWLAIYNDANSDPNTAQPWVTPTGGVISEGTNGVGPWGTKSGISASADWIDAANNGLSICQNCTVDFSTTITSASSGVPEPGTLTLLLGALSIASFLAIRRLKTAQDS
jgi:hypothetical protein